MDVFAALMTIASCGLHLKNCIAARVGYGVSRVPAVSDFELAYVCWWEDTSPDEVYCCECHGVSHLSMELLVGSQWKSTQFLQFLLATQDDVERVQDSSPMIPNLGRPCIPEIELWRERNAKRARSDTDSNNPTPHAYRLLNTPTGSDQHAHEDENNAHALADDNPNHHND
eukprot:4720595-Karenia_brevis.AAC.1